MNLKPTANPFAPARIVLRAALIGLTLLLGACAGNPYDSAPQAPAPAPVPRAPEPSGPVIAPPPIKAPPAPGLQPRREAIRVTRRRRTWRLIGTIAWVSMWWRGASCTIASDFTIAGMATGSARRARMALGNRLHRPACRRGCANATELHAEAVFCRSV